MIEQLIRKHLLTFQPYTSARSEVQAGQIFLDANELSLGSPVTFDGISLNRYPDPFQQELRAKLSSRLCVSPGMVFTGVGSDEIIDLLLRLFCEPTEDTIAILEPTYGVYRVAANLNGVRTNSINLTEQGQIDMEKTLQSIESSTKLVFLCSPNNPLGNLLNSDDILTLCNTFNAIVVVDQAYIEFADSKGDVSAEVLNHENLVVLRTLSKAWGLAGIRLGYCIAHPRIISYLHGIKSPYNINAVTSQLALRALDRPQFLNESVQSIIAERERMMIELATLPEVCAIYPSDANFILVEFQNAHIVYQRLIAHGIVVRRRSESTLVNCLRLTVGTHGENSILLHALRNRE